MLGDSVLETRSLCKEYRRRRVVDNVSLQVRHASVVGLLGPNGTDRKSTRLNSSHGS